MRYAAPPHVTGITLSTGPLVVVDGFIDVPDDLSLGDIGGLINNGFYPAPPEGSPSESPTPVKTAPPAKASPPTPEIKGDAPAPTTQSPST